MLEPVYLKRASFPELMATLEARLDSSQDPDERRPLLKRLAGTCDWSWCEFRFLRLE